MKDFVMSERKCFILTLAIIIAAILLAAAFSFCVSGVRENSDRLFSLTDGRTYNSLIIRKFPFDSVILGSSMSQGFKCSEFDAAFGGQSMKLCAAGANFAEVKEILDFAVKHKKIKRAMLDTPVAFFGRDLTLDSFPLEYYQENNDMVRLKKSFSINAFIDEFDFFWDYLRGKVKYTTRDELYDWNRRRSCSESLLAQDVLYSSGKNYLKDDIAYKNAIVKAENVILPIFRKYSDIEFILFFPPYSMMYYQDKDHDKYLALKKKITELLLSCPNVKLYDFETAFPVMKNLNNYKDRTHYSGVINSWMISQMKDGNYRVTVQNKDKFSADFRECLKSYDFQKEYDRLKSTYGNSNKVKKSKKSKKSKKAQK